MWLRGDKSGDITSYFAIRVHVNTMLTYAFSPLALLLISMRAPLNSRGTLSLELKKFIVRKSPVNLRTVANRLSTKMMFYLPKNQYQPEGTLLFFASYEPSQLISLAYLLAMLYVL